MTPSQRSELIRQRLVHEFSPTQLEIIDESAQHKGHVGSQSGAGHYAIVIAAECFKNQSMLAAHRLIYAALSDLLPEEIHALKIKIVR